MRKKRLNMSFFCRSCRPPFFCLLIFQSESGTCSVHFPRQRYLYPVWVNFIWNERWENNFLTIRQDQINQFRIIGCFNPVLSNKGYSKFPILQFYISLTKTTKLKLFCIGLITRISFRNLFSFRTFHRNTMIKFLILENETDPKRIILHSWKNTSISWLKF